MKQIKREEVFGSFKDFLKSKGIELQEGPYAHRIQQGCDLLTDSVNLSQRALTKTKTAVEGSLEQLRQVIHEKTAPKAPAASDPKTTTATSSPPPQAKQAKRTKPVAKKAKPANKRAKR